MADETTTWVPLADLKPWVKNARQHSDESTRKLAAGIRRFGFLVPLTAWRAEQRIAAGHGRRLAMQALLSEDPTFVPRNAPPGTAPGMVPVMWEDFASERQFEAFAISDNRQAKNAADDELAIAEVLRALEADGLDFDGMGFDDDELDDLLALAGEEATDLDEADDDVPEVEEGEADSQLGEVYQLGPHRLVCGDSTKDEVWTQLLEGDTHRPRCLWSDPPYGVAYVGGTAEALTIQNDALSAEGLQDLLRASLGHAAERCEPGAAWYVASPHNAAMFYAFATVLNDLGIWRHTIVWVKDRFVLGRCDYHYRHESLFYGWVPGGAHYWCGDRTLDSVHEVPRPSRNKEHPTMKPVALVRRHLEASSKPGWIVVEPFGGSGTTLLACAGTNRIARVIELDPRYCDVIRRRWTRWAREHNRDPGSGALD